MLAVDLSEKGLEQTVATITEAGGTAESCVADVTDESSVRRYAQRGTALARSRESRNRRAPLLEPAGDGPQIRDQLRQSVARALEPGGVSGSVVIDPPWLSPAHRPVLPQ